MKIFQDIKSLNSIIKITKPQKVLLVTGANSFECLKAKKYIEIVLKNENVLRYKVIHPNPELREVKKAIKIFNRFNPCLIIAIGGGSVIDTAKLMFSLPAKNKIANLAIYDPSLLEKTRPYFVVIPTTSGSGSEATSFAVLYKGNQKFSIQSKLFLPDFVILDFRLTTTMPPVLTAVTGLDALCQSIESLWAIGATKSSKNYAQKSLNIILKSFPEVVFNPTNKLRSEMLKASFYAGKAINISKTTAPHAISYALTIKYGIPHGHAVALTIGKVTSINLKEDSKKQLKKYLLNKFNLKKESDFIEYFEVLLEKLKLESRIQYLYNYKKSDIKYLVSKVNLERLNNNPSKITESMLHEILS
jgi:alcohol dehydrogenase class IV